MVVGATIFSAVSISERRAQRMDAAHIAEWIHPAGLIRAVAIPLGRAILRRARGQTPSFVKAVLVHDAMMGMVAPTFVALCLSPIARGLLSELNPTTAFLAGVMGLFFLLENLFRSD